MLEIRTDDDAGFILQAGAFIADTLAQETPDSAYVLRVKGWFGPRWLGFSGKILGAAGVHNLQRLTLPPFVPNRILSQVFVKQVDSAYQLVPSPIRLHRSYSSSDSLLRYMDSIVPGSAVFWVSSNSTPCGRGAYMAYLPLNDRTYRALYRGFTIAPFRLVTQAQLPPDTGLREGTA